ncbi:penicillin-binding protein activator [Desulfovibrio sp. OttesenSCG-928-G15]|nr:penicillin-binding protein activator [Desulfovibrio sp. OttesenSCG-928-G15]
MKTAISRPRCVFSPRYTVFVLLFVLLLPTGCADIFSKISLGGDDEPVMVNPIEDLSSAFNKGNYGKAETLAMRHLKNAGLGLSHKIEANRLLVGSALHNNHPSVAINALEEWRKLAPGADGTREWQDAWAKAMRTLSSHDARTRANDIYQDSSRSALIRCISGVVLAARQWNDGDLGQSMVALENIYQAVNTTKDKAALEQRLAIEMNAANPAASNLAYSAVTDANRNKFPYNVVYVDQMRRTKQLAAAQAKGSSLRLADPSIIRSVPRESIIGTSIQSGGTGAVVSGQPIVLALPLSGQYAPLSEKIAAGAKVACDEMMAAGGHVQLMVIDTDGADWISKINALPGNATIVGGPLRRADYTTLKEKGILGKRAVFAFLPSLDGSDEGQNAWRFFSSAQDQVDTLLGFTDKLGIKEYGVFYPDDNFGRRMQNIFEERVRANGATVTASSYPPENQKAWSGSAKVFIESKKGTPFKAVFLPDAWKHMETIIPAFFTNKETGQVLLGTSLWEQSLSKGAYGTPQYYELAVFPGTWNQQQPSAMGQKLQAGLSKAGQGTADFWYGLGYDFARLTAKLGVREGWTAPQVNKLLERANLNWSIAPIRWDKDGHASQKMHLFQPVSGGFVPLNEGTFKKRLGEANP